MRVQKSSVKYAIHKSINNFLSEKIYDLIINVNTNSYKWFLLNDLSAKEVLLTFKDSNVPYQ